MLSSSFFAGARCTLGLGLILLGRFGPNESAAVAVAVLLGPIVESYLEGQHQFAVMQNGHKISRHKREAFCSQAN